MRGEHSVSVSPPPSPIPGCRAVHIRCEQASTHGLLAQLVARTLRILQLREVVGSTPTVSIYFCFSLCPLPFGEHPIHWDQLWNVESARMVESAGNVPISNI